jgi:CRISPR-associated protein Csb2
MSNALLISVRFHEGRYHGAGDWPPSPARLFQALIAGAGLQGPLQIEQVDALKWLETMPPPIMAAPAIRKGQPLGVFVPNNDLDAVGGDPRRIGSIRAKKEIRPLLFDAGQPLLYAWPLGDESSQGKFAHVLCQLAEKVYQLGRGVDLAWAWAEIIDDAEVARRLDGYVGTVHRPSLGGAGKPVSCPVSGSFPSLEKRYHANASRFEAVKIDRAVSQNFRRQPKPRFQSVAYDSSPTQRLFDLRSVNDPEQFQAWDLERASLLIECIRDAVFKKLATAFPAKRAQIEHWLIGRNADGSNGGKADERIRLIPLASIGHAHADYGIRRVFIEAPANCPIRSDDLFWAFNGVELGEGADLSRLSASEDGSFLRHYGIGPAATDWQTITPAALPDSAKRRRIEPSRRLAEAKSASERAREQEQARVAVLTALRHAGLNLKVLDVVVQREPFQSHGARAEGFAPGTRFAKERLWHVAIKFAGPIQGPLVLGDGRFLGLGVFAPCLWE